MTLSEPKFDLFGTLWIVFPFILMWLQAIFRPVTYSVGNNINTRVFNRSATQSEAGETGRRETAQSILSCGRGSENLREPRIGYHRRHQTRACGCGSRANSQSYRCNSLLAAGDRRGGGQRRVNRPVLWSTNALADLADQIAYIAIDNQPAARRLASALDKKALALGDMPIGRPGRVIGTYEKSVTGLLYVVAYAIMQTGGTEEIAIVRVIHTSRDWSAETWPD